MAKVKFYDQSDRCVAVISFALPGGGGGATVAGVGDDRADALARAASIAHRIATDPVMSALMPPQARAAIVAARGLAAAAKRGLPVLKSFWRRIKGPGKKRLARALMEEAAKREVADVADVGFSLRKAAMFAANPFAAAQYYGGKKLIRKLRGKRRSSRSSRSSAPRASSPPPMRRPMPPQESEPAPEQYDEPAPEQYDEPAPEQYEQYDDGAESQS